MKPLVETAPDRRLAVCRRGRLQVGDREARSRKPSVPSRTPAAWIRACPGIDFVYDRLLPERTIDPVDVERILVTDSPEEAVGFLTRFATGRFGWTYGPRPKRRWFFWE